MQARPVGTNAVLIECSDVAHARATYDRVLGLRAAGTLVATDVVPAERSVLVDGIPDQEQLLSSVMSWQVQPAAVGEERPLVEIPVVYDGPDLGRVAAHWGVSAEEVVARHQRIEFTVAFCGFAPGFAYCTGLPEELSLPRLEQPRASVPAGSVALAGVYAAVYPRSSPGGWLVIGHSDLTLWDAAADEPALLTPGTRVRYADA